MPPPVPLSAALRVLVKNNGRVSRIDSCHQRPVAKQFELVPDAVPKVTGNRLTSVNPCPSSVLT
jgi:hypothetical protein